MRTLPGPLFGLVLGPVFGLGLVLAGCSLDADPVQTPPGQQPVVPTVTAPTGRSDPADPADPAERDGRTDPATTRPLAGKVVVLDPGHQLGNRNFAARINQDVDAGGFTKACNTTGTATDAGYPEATFTWQVAGRTAALLRRLGARVVLTRADNSDDAWGPCVDERGRIGNPGAGGLVGDLRVSIHADGVRASGATGFHVIRPGRLEGWNDDIEADSQGLAEKLRDALVAGGWEPSTYRGVDGVDVRSDLGTLNLSDIPAAMVELGNMRDDGEAAVMSSGAGQQRYARALVAGVRAWLTR